MDQTHFQQVTTTHPIIRDIPFPKVQSNTSIIDVLLNASAQTRGTETTVKAAIHHLNYAVTHPDATARFRAARSRLNGYFCLSDHPKLNIKSPLNGAFHVVCTILRNVVASATEDEVGPLRPRRRHVLHHTPPYM